MFFFAENFLHRAWLFFSCSLARQIFLFLHFLGSGRAEPWAAPGGPFPEHPGVLKRVPVSGEHRVGADCQPGLGNIPKCGRAAITALQKVDAGLQRGATALGMGAAVVGPLPGDPEGKDAQAVSFKVQKLHLGS